MPVNLRSGTWFTAGVLFAAVTPVTAFDAPDRVVDLPQLVRPRPITPTLTGWGLDPDGGLFVVAGGNTLVAGAAGQPATIAPARGLLGESSALHSELLPWQDRGWLGTDGCAVIHVDAALIGRWRTELADRYCWVAPPIDTGDGIAVVWRNANSSTGHLAMLDDNGHERWRVSTDVGGTLARPPLLAQDGEHLYMALPNISSTGRRGYSVVAFDAEGGQLWQSHSGANRSLELRALSRHGGGIDIAATGDDGTLWLHALDASGRPTGERQLQPEGGFRTEPAVLDGAGGGYALAHGPEGRWRVHRFSTAAGWLWSRDTPLRCQQGDAISAQQCLRVTPDGGVLLIGRGNAAVQRWSSGGVERLYREYRREGFGGFFHFALAPDNDTTVLALSWSGASAGIIESGRVLEWWRGSERIADIDLDWDTQDIYHPLAHAVAASGRLLLATGHRDGAPAGQLIVIGPDGAVADERELSAGLSRPQAIASTDDGGVCLYSQTGGLPNLACFPPGSAEPVWQAEHAPTGMGATLRVRHDGGVDLIRLGHSMAITPPRRDAQWLTRHGADGQVLLEQLFRQGDDTGSLLNTSASGWLAALSRAGRLTRVAPDLEVSVLPDSLPRPFALDPVSLPGTVADDGAVAYVGAGEDENERVTVLLVQVDADGSARNTVLGLWPAAMEQRQPVRSAMARHLPDGDVLVRVDQRTGAGRWAPGDHLFLARVGRDGDLLWRRRWTGSDERDFEVLHNDAGDIVVASRRGYSGHVLRWLDADGALLDQREIDCGETPCAFLRFGLADDGGVFVLRRNAASPALPLMQVMRFNAPDQDTVLPVTADGLDGTWYSPLQGGQGFGLSRYPQSGHAQVFLPWFTFGDVGGNDPAQLRWLTVQGEVEDDDTEAALVVLENTGGRFAAPPATTARPIGGARLRIHDCARATLEYRLDGGNEDSVAPEGSIALRRLLPAAGACAGEDDIEIDPLLTGNWYDPAQAGQGLDLHRILVAGRPLLFGAWYTFDPAAPVGDAGDQHWFTLQGESIAADGSIETIIVQTLGGRFDGVPTANHHRVGTATLLGDDCRRLTLDYRFDDDRVAGAFRSLTGRLQLARLGACH